MLSVSDSCYISIIAYVLRAAHGEREAVHSFFELLRVCILSMDLSFVVVFFGLFFILIY